MDMEHLRGGTKAIREGLWERARKRGARVLESFDPKAYEKGNSRQEETTPIPTHIIVSNYTSSLDPRSVVRALGFASVNECQLFLGRHNIRLVKRSWAAKGNKFSYPPFAPVSIREEYLDIIPDKGDKQGVKNDGQAANENSSDKTKRGSLPLQDCPPTPDPPHAPKRSRPPSSPNAESSLAQLTPRRRQNFATNTELAGLFHSLSKLYQSAPLYSEEIWKAYTFHIISTRIKHLDFEITTSEDGTWKRLATLPGFGSSCMEIVREFVTAKEGNATSGMSDSPHSDDEDDGTGVRKNDTRSYSYCRRIVELQTNPQRVAMRQFMKIHGVGRVKAEQWVTGCRGIASVNGVGSGATSSRESIRKGKRGVIVQDDNEGYHSIEQLRRAVFETNQLTLDRNQLIGLLCYEDINEEMPRAEVEAIFEVVKDVTQQSLLPGASLELMGSYRRHMKETCGDIDILITHPNYWDSLPSNTFLGELVDELCLRGHLSYHLTFLAGMDPEKFETLDAKYAKCITDATRNFGRLKIKRDPSASSCSYMGVFRSPITGKNRRIDIKVYPHRERIFAILYFTGNGHFNRSMRLWAKYKFNYRLSDQGLFYLDTQSRVMVSEASKDGEKEARPKKFKTIVDARATSGGSGKLVVFQPTSERDVFDFLNLVWKEPHERDGFDAVEGYGDYSSGGVGRSIIHDHHAMKKLTRPEIMSDYTSW